MLQVEVRRMDRVKMWEAGYLNAEDAPGWRTSHIQPTLDVLSNANMRWETEGWVLWTRLRGTSWVPSRKIPPFGLKGDGASCGSSSQQRLEMEVPVATFDRRDRSMHCPLIHPGNIIYAEALLEYKDGSWWDTLIVYESPLRVRAM